MYGGEFAVRYVFPPNPVDPTPHVDPKPDQQVIPPVKPDQQVVVPPKPVDPPVKPENSTNNNNPPITNVDPSRPVDPQKPNDRPSPWDHLFPPTTPTNPTVPNFDWITPPNRPAINPPAINPQNPWSIPNDFQNLFNPQPSK